MNRVVTATAAAIAVGVTVFFGAPAQAATPGQDLGSALCALAKHIQEILAAVPGATTAVDVGAAGPQQPADLMKGGCAAVDAVQEAAAATAGDALLDTAPAVRQAQKTVRETPALGGLGVDKVTPVPDAVTPMVADFANGQFVPVVIPAVMPFLPTTG